METVIGKNDVVVRKFSSGSALILAVVLTSLLAVVGVLFVMTRRVDMVATSAISVDRDLDLAVDSVVAKIEEELIRDLDFALQEYYDYPDKEEMVHPGDDGTPGTADDELVGDRWLASLEPYDMDNAPGFPYDYLWPRITDLYEAPGQPVKGLLRDLADSPWVDAHGQNVGASNLQPRIILANEPVTGISLTDGSGATREYGGPADADGDGVADSRWIRLPAMTGSKGQRVYAAIRMIDNGGMANVNIAYPINPTSAEAPLLDGFQLSQINLFNIVKGLDDPCDLHWARCNGGWADLETFNREYVMRVGNPDSTNTRYLPFEITDELDLRNRFLLDVERNTARIEAAMPVTLTHRSGLRFRNRYAPIADSCGFASWQEMMDPLAGEDAGLYYDFRHLLTTYSGDRVVNAGPVTYQGQTWPVTYQGQTWGYGRLVSINNITEKLRGRLLYDAVLAGLAAGGGDDPNDPNVAGQIVANIIDYKDVDMDITAYHPNPDDPTIEYFGFERPCVYISELAYGFQDGQFGYAIEFHNPHAKYNRPDVRVEELRWLKNGGLWLAIDLDGKGVDVDDVQEQLHWEGKGDPSFSYVKYDQTGLITAGDPNSPDPPNDGRFVDPNVTFSWPDANCDTSFSPSYNVYWGVDFNDVDSATKAVPGDANHEFDVNTTSFKPPDELENNTTYYWRVDAEWDLQLCEEGEIWNFETGVLGGGGTFPPFTFESGSVVELRRQLKTSTKEPDRFVVVDRVKVPAELVGDASRTVTRSYERDITRHKCIMRLWMDPASISTLDGRVGDENTYVDTVNTQMIPAYPYMDAGVYDIDVDDGGVAFKNIGELGMIFTRPAYYDPDINPDPDGHSPAIIGYSRPSETEDEVRINFADPSFQQLLNFITVFDPSSDGINNDGDTYWRVQDNMWPELKDEYDGLYEDGNIPGAAPPDGRPDPGDEVQIAGRININTSPWYVIAQLPWVMVDVPDPMERYALARAIVAYRDKLQLNDSKGAAVANYTDRTFGTGSPFPLRPEPGFASVAELINVTHDLGDPAAAAGDPNYDIRRYGRDSTDASAFPDLTASDGAVDDFEERDMIVSLVSNLVTVRSDVFTAYILVRLGLDGPQKRVIAILDRSDVYGPGDKVKVRALHPVPDPR
jgi:hypothetical protein